MAVVDLMTQTVTITTYGAPVTMDDYGNPLPKETSTSVNVYFEQLAEKMEEGYVPEARYRMFLPAGTLIQAEDKVVDADGAVYRVEGPADDMFNPRTRKTSHIEATLTRTQGALE